MVAIFAWSWTILHQVSLIIINPVLPAEGLIMSVIIGIIVIVASGLISHFLGRIYKDIFRERSEKTEEKQYNVPQ